MNVTPIKQGATNADNLRALLKAMVDEMPVQIEIAATLAKIRREKFKAYLREGFTEAQAMELVRAEVR